MINQYLDIDFELLSDSNLNQFTELTLELWPDCDYAEEQIYLKRIMSSLDNFCALARYNDHYVGFVHIAIRNDYVEGAETNGTAYLEGIYIKPKYRLNSFASYLLSKGESWVKLKGFNQLASDTEIGDLSSQQFHMEIGFNAVNRIVCYLKDL